MSASTLTTPPSRTIGRLYRARLLVLGLLSVGDLLAPLLTDGEHPPMFIALIGAAIGAVSLGLIWLCWSRPRLWALAGLLVLRLVEALTAVPAFVFEDVPRALAAVAVVGTLLAAVFTIVGRRYLRVATS